MSDMDALVELAARALCIDAKHEGNQPFDDWHKEQARAALLAVGLPALLERVEAAEDDARWLKAQWEDACAEERRLTADRDALAAKVAAVGERIALAIEAEAAELANDPGHPMFESGAQSAFVLAAALARHASETP